METASGHFPLIFREKLKGEVVVMYSSGELTPAVSLQRIWTENSLQSTFSETLYLVQTAITAPHDIDRVREVPQ